MCILDRFYYWSTVSGSHFEPSCTLQCAVGLQRHDTLTWGIWCMHCHGFFRGILFTVIDAIVACGVANLMIVQCVGVCVRACVLAVIGSMYLWGWVYLFSTVLMPFCTVIAFLSQKVQILMLRAVLVGLLLWLPARVATGRSPNCFSNMVSNYNIVMFGSSLFFWQVLKHCLCKPYSLHACGCATQQYCSVYELWINCPEWMFASISQY